MLFALRGEERIRANKELLYYREGGRYKCPSQFCEEPELILKKGRNTLPHFAHKSKCKCGHHAEGETEAHIKMKEYLKQLLDISDEFVEYTQIRGVRPDLLWGDFVIEVQHSPISIEEIMRRNTIYHKNKLVPIWILHAHNPYYSSIDNERFNYNPQYMSKIGRDTYKLKASEIFLLNKNCFLLYFYFWNAEIKCSLGVSRFINVKRTNEYIGYSYNLKTHFGLSDQSSLLLEKEEILWIFNFLKNRTKRTRRCRLCPRRRKGWFGNCTFLDCREYHTKNSLFVNSGLLDLTKLDEAKKPTENKEI